MMHRIYLHPLPVRIWHWVNAFTCVMLLLTGAQLRYVGLIDVVSFRTAVRLHNYLGFLMIANFFLWLGYYLCSPRIRTWQTELNLVKFFQGMMGQTMYYTFGIFKRDRPPFQPSVYNKFNPLQIMTYQVIMFFVLPVQAITGLMLWNILGFSHTVAFVGGVRVVDTVHVLIFIFFVFFIPAHFYLGTLGRRPITHFKEMYTGYEEEEADEGTHAPAPRNRTTE
jgi:thiosulfate reductase cytochrome b subunit